VALFSKITTGQTKIVRGSIFENHYRSDQNSARLYCVAILKK
jgi:hypothetical protein